MAPQGRVRWVFALHGVVADELEGELVVSYQHLCGQCQRSFNQGAVLAASTVGISRTGRSRLECDRKRREERSVERNLEMAERRNEAGREVILQLHRSGLDDLRLRQRKVNGVVRVDSAKD